MEALFISREWINKHCIIIGNIGFILTDDGLIWDIQPVNNNGKIKENEMKNYQEIETAKPGDEVYIIDDDGRLKCTYICDLRDLNIKSNYPHIVYDEWYGTLQSHEIFKKGETK